MIAVHNHSSENGHRKQFNNLEKQIINFANKNFWLIELKVQKMRKKPEKLHDFGLPFKMTF